VAGYDFRGLREKIIVALVSDDYLFERIVLKGGNALEIVHGVVHRGSLDLDFSLQDDFDDLDDARERIRKTLERAMRAEGLALFDFSFEEKPAGGATAPAWWGGYQVAFKLIPQQLADQLASDIDAWRRRSLRVGESTQERIFSVDISKHEYCEGKISVKLHGYAVFVYSLELIVAEKLRALCQQMDGVVPPRTKRQRARDYFDIVRIGQHGFDLPEVAKLLPGVFAAKGVELKWLSEIRNHRASHQAGWDEVRASAGPAAGDFDDHAAVVERLVDQLCEMLGNV